ncbi:MAG: GNAT family N-acetyltransferase [Roseobacter sp.]|jgi:ribosomal protein S18 acetylase RimI-like enzyme|nr:GNAT family N-acetyltransferase [Roseobacter sp.]
MQYEPYTQALYAALYNDPFYKALKDSLANPEQAAAAMRAYYELSMRDAAKWGRLTLPEQGHHGAAVWALPLEDSQAKARQAEREKALYTALGPEGCATYNAMDAAISEREAVMDLDGFWYLSILGVDPALQGRGLGAQLVRPGLEEADAAGVPSFLTSFSPGNFAFYEGLGFRVVAAFPEEVTGTEFSVLVRPVPVRAQ